MDLEPIRRAATISESVLTRLTEEILSGRWPADRPAPSERDLALTLQVNRNAVREALKVLQHAGLLKIEHGGKTMVLDWRSHAGMEMIGALTAAGVIPAGQALMDGLWMNRRVGPDAARLCARNASDEQLAAVAAAATAASWSSLAFLAQSRAASGPILRFIQSPSTKAWPTGITPAAVSAPIISMPALECQSRTIVLPPCSILSNPACCSTLRASRTALRLT